MKKISRSIKEEDSECSSDESNDRPVQTHSEKVPAAVYGRNNISSGSKL